MVMTNELKESDIKNYPCYYFDDMISQKQRKAARVKVTATF